MVQFIGIIPGVNMGFNIGTDNGTLHLSSKDSPNPFVTDYLSIPYLLDKRFLFLLKIRLISRILTVQSVFKIS